MKSTATEDFRLVFLPLSDMQPENRLYYRSAVDCWERVWLDLFDEHRVEQPLFLDHFLRQDEAACIFNANECIAMILFRTVDFSVLNFNRDSYFKEWNSDDLKVLLSHGSRAFLATFLTVDPRFRAFKKEFRFKEVLLDVMVKRFLISQADVISGVTRRDRRIHDESYKLGARPVHENVDYMGGRFRVDLVAFYRHEVKESTNTHVREFSDGLWRNRLDLNRHFSVRELKVA